ncbi:hypothetical protein HGP14_23685 [Rhizobium sp. P32RR-XVIII]|uniref:hypothetical protein n=1 Tax=Rhizobium sp. P32RR-XVIII TaxID=2726738 RepID=UPI001456DE82|nr:hypothetical protein [Rhizobium sp. P32RR-XVIII]NLS06322.1 hypothetical protein [Rhizobium sp. P32RR-XVIII]
MTYPQLRSEDPELEHEIGSGLPSLVLAALGVVCKLVIAMASNESLKYEEISKHRNCDPRGI